MNPTIHETAAALRRGELSPVDVLERCFARIDQLEERVRAWAFIDRVGARAQAERLTQELQAGQDRGPLHGIPVGVKDIIDVFDLPTGCGSVRWANSYARRDATCVARLRQAGAVIVGKTVTTAYASFDPPVTRNPWDATKTPGGSSSGSAAAVACGMCLGALATQTGGSITRPASYCGVCSLKPTHGAVSVDGVLPLAPSLDHVGVMANCVRDLALLFQVIAEPRKGRIPNCLGALERGQRWRPTFVRLRGLFDERATPRVRAVMDRLRHDLRSGTDGAAVVWDAVPPAGFADILPRHHTLMAVEAAAYHAERFRRHPDDYPPCITALIEEGMRCPATEHENGARQRAQLAEEFARGGLQYLTPATPDAAPDAATTGDPAFNSPWSYLGLPTISVPIHWTAEGLPLSVQLTDRPRGETTVFALAAFIERVLEEMGRFARRKVQ